MPKRRSEWSRVLYGEDPYFSPGIYEPWQLFGDDAYIEPGTDELWAETEYEGYYISTYGRLYNAWTGRVLIPVAAKQGYWTYTISYYDEEGHVRVKRVLAHRMVAEAFIPNPNGLPIVRHLDDRPWNNYVDNLAWGTMYDNHCDCVANGHYNGLNAYCRSRRNEEMQRPVKVTSTLTGKASIYPSFKIACDQLGVHRSNACKVAKGERSKAQGYVFEYLEDYNGSEN